MDIRQLRYFTVIVQQGSFSRAAEVLNVAQPALSLHLRNMESDLGRKLLFRTARGVVPTEEGEILLRHARHILDQLVLAEDEIRGHQNDPSGEVRLGLPGTISQMLSVPLITAARARYPRIKLRIAEAMSGFVLDWMRAGRVDLAVLYALAAEPGIETLALLEEELVFFRPTPTPAPASTRASTSPPAPAGPQPGSQPGLTGGRIGFHDLAALPLILPAAGHGLRDLLARHAAAAGISLNTVIDVDSYANIKALVAAGHGCSVLPAHAIRHEVRQGSLCALAIDGPPIRRGVHLAHATDRPVTNAVRVIRELAAEILLDLARSGQWTGVTLLAGGDERPERPGR